LTGVEASGYPVSCCPLQASVQQLKEETFGSAGVSPSLNQDIKHITILINGTPEILSSTLDRDEDFVEMPRVAQTALPPLDSPGVFRAELGAPLTDGFIRDRYAALSKEIFNISKAHAEAVVEPDAVADDFRRKSISPVAGGVAVHRAIVPDTAST